MQSELFNSLSFVIHRNSRKCNSKVVFLTLGSSLARLKCTKAGQDSKTALFLLNSVRSHLAKQQAFWSIFSKFQARSAICWFMSQFLEMSTFDLIPAQNVTIKARSLPSLGESVPKQVRTLKQPFFCSTQYDLTLLNIKLFEAFSWNFKQDLLFADSCHNFWRCQLLI